MAGLGQKPHLIPIHAYSATNFTFTQHFVAFSKIRAGMPFSKLSHYFTPLYSLAMHQVCIKGQLFEDIHSSKSVSLKVNIIMATKSSIWKILNLSLINTTSHFNYRKQIIVSQEYILYLQTYKKVCLRVIIWDPFCFCFLFCLFSCF